MPAMQLWEHHSKGEWLPVPTDREEISNAIQVAADEMFPPYKDRDAFWRLWKHLRGVASEIDWQHAETYIRSLEKRLRCTRMTTTLDQDEVFTALCGMSDRAVDPKAKERMRALMHRSKEDIKDELLGLIDDIVFCAWTSDFEIKVLHVVWKACGGTDEELQNRDVSNTPKNKEKYKWQR